MDEFPHVEQYSHVKSASDITVAYDNTDSDLNVDDIRLLALTEMRLRLLEKKYKYPIWCHKFTQILIVLWALVSTIIISIFCIKFDVKLNAENNFQHVIDASECNDTYYDITTNMAVI